MTAQGLDAWATDTNGSLFSDETKEEMLEFLDVTDLGDLTFKGFLQIYQLQTENEEDETWNDLVGPIYMLRNGSDGRVGQAWVRSNTESIYVVQTSRDGRPANHRVSSLWRASRRPWPIFCGECG